MKELFLAWLPVIWAFSASGCWLSVQSRNLIPCGWHLQFHLHNTVLTDYLGQMAKLKWALVWMRGLITLCSWIGGLCSGNEPYRHKPCGRHRLASDLGTAETEKSQLGFYKHSTLNFPIQLGCEVPEGQFLGAERAVNSELIKTVPDIFMNDTARIKLRLLPK